jgi:hypothetical protein
MNVTTCRPTALARLRASRWKLALGDLLRNGPTRSIPSDEARRGGELPKDAESVHAGREEAFRHKR